MRLKPISKPPVNPTLLQLIQSLIDEKEQKSSFSPVVVGSLKAALPTYIQQKIEIGEPFYLGNIDISGEQTHILKEIINTPLSYSDCGLSGNITIPGFNK